MMMKKMFGCRPLSSSSGLSLAAVVLCLCLLLCLSFSVQQSSSYSLRRRFGVDYYGNGRGIAAGDWHRGEGGALDHLAFPSPSATGRQQQQQRLDEDDSSSSSSNPGVLFYAGPKFLQQMGRVLESSRDTPSSVAGAGVAATGGAGGGGGGVSVAEDDRLRKMSSSLFRPTERQIQQFRESADWSIPMTSSVAKRNLCCSLDMYCVDCSDRK